MRENGSSFVYLSLLRRAAPITTARTVLHFIFFLLRSTEVVGLVDDLRCVKRALCRAEFEQQEGVAEPAARVKAAAFLRFLGRQEKGCWGRGLMEGKKKQIVILVR